MKIILDENLPRPLKYIFPGHSVTTVQEQGLAGTINGELLGHLEGTFDVFITADKNLRYQQNLSGRALAILDYPPIACHFCNLYFPGLWLPSNRSRPAATSN